MARAVRLQTENEILTESSARFNHTDRVNLARSFTAEMGGYWIPACGGTETPFKTRSGLTVLYCWNPVTCQHAYIDMSTDMVLSDEDAIAALAIN